MQLGLYAHTHGLGYREGEDNRTASVPAATLQPAAVAVEAERAGFHSMWFPDHVCMPTDTASAHVANTSGTRSYQPRHDMLDAAVVMGAAATVTSTIRLGTSVLVAPYRHPLADMRQLTTVDVLSNGRLMLGVGEGWMEEEFTALGLDRREKGRRTIECIEIYKRCWSDDVVAFDGEYYRFADVSMDPKPVQSPRPPIIYGGVSPLGARRAARRCDGFYPLFLDPYAEPTRYREHQDEIRRVLDEIGRDPASFMMMGAATLQFGDAETTRGADGCRMICSGSSDEILEDLADLAAEGYSLVVLKLVCPSGETAELIDNVQRVGQELIPQAAGIQPDGGWLPITPG